MNQKPVENHPFSSSKPPVYIPPAGRPGQLPPLYQPPAGPFYTAAKTRLPAARGKNSRSPFRRKRSPTRFCLWRCERGRSKSGRRQRFSLFCVPFFGTCFHTEILSAPSA